MSCHEIGLYLTTAPASSPTTFTPPFFSSPLELQPHPPHHRISPDSTQPTSTQPQYPPTSLHQPRPKPHNMATPRPSISTPAVPSPLTAYALSRASSSLVPTHIAPICSQTRRNHRCRDRSRALTLFRKASRRRGLLA
ncbi:hypothetical protein K458DRAFT_198237 [Lentithecium fluviatile CBS 122367]|uniref:Uncharacterized protein n=1 Tax=Lentithecium fluviatile CBS 122367 TaxID=1168545 RepID=A0A6G1J7E2_9PLEO|nr:hypothetical protein K458DRAFT_198237 [Lentithecium fluviatile CBS 122367]